MGHKRARKKKIFNISYSVRGQGLYDVCCVAAVCTTDSKKQSFGIVKSFKLTDDH